ncbi:DUF1453 domain-containing protein [Luteimonas sp. RD2P54]|uniref:DUF1453 domain-containing protein n=1 Tax=Luteimonas endophytica TaxID=3042023 RepID=A0ABT6JDC7_9GAMM|nr:DUF1453 domain-containing protein [Luteimonas endophytica]MDH5824835.1 DUF1453 domain-containing protein [Luteimonas endophytica]
MPLLLIPVLVLFGLVAVLLLWPLGLWLQLRAGGARRRAPAWAVRLNALLLPVSAALFLAGAAMSGVWIEAALAHAAAGLLAGVLLARAGLSITRFEYLPTGLHYTPNRWLARALVILVATRIGLGLWQLARRLQGIPADTGGESAWQWLTAPAGVFAAGGLLLGYHAAYAWGLRRRVRLA